MNELKLKSYLCIAEDKLQTDSKTSKVNYTEGTQECELKSELKEVNSMRNSIIKKLRKLGTQYNQKRLKNINEDYREKSNIDQGSYNKKIEFKNSKLNNDTDNIGNEINIIYLRFAILAIHIEATIKYIDSINTKKYFKIIILSIGERLCSVNIINRIKNLYILIKNYLNILDSKIILKTLKDKISLKQYATTNKILEYIIKVSQTVHILILKNTKIEIKNSRKYLKQQKEYSNKVIKENKAADNIGNNNKLIKIEANHKKIDNRHMQLRSNKTDKKEHGNKNKNNDSDTTELVNNKSGKNSDTYSIEIKTTEPVKRGRGRPKTTTMDSSNMIDTINEVIEKANNQNTPIKDNESKKRTPTKQKQLKRVKIQACETVSEKKQSNSKKRNLVNYDIEEIDEQPSITNSKKQYINILKKIINRSREEKEDEEKMEQEMDEISQINTNLILKILEHPIITIDNRTFLQILNTKLLSNQELCEEEIAKASNIYRQYNDHINKFQIQLKMLKDAKKVLNDKSIDDILGGMDEKNIISLDTQIRIDEIESKFTLYKKNKTLIDDITEMIQCEEFTESKTIAPLLIKLKENESLNATEISTIDEIKNSYIINKENEALLWLFQTFKEEWQLSDEDNEQISKLNNKVMNKTKLNETENNEIMELIVQFLEDDEEESDEYEWDSDEYSITTSPKAKRINHVTKEERAILVAEHYSKIKKIIDENEDLERNYPREQYTVILQGKCLSLIENDFEDRKKKLFDYKRVADPESCELIMVNKEEYVGKFRDECNIDDFDTKKRMIRIRVDNYDDYIKLLTPWADEIFGGDVIATMVPNPLLKIKIEIETEVNVEEVKEDLEDKYGICNVKRVNKIIQNKTKKKLEEPDLIEIPTKMVIGEALSLHHYINAIKNKIYVNQSKRVVKFCVDHAKCCPKCPSITHSYCKNEEEFCHRCGLKGHRMAKCQNEVRCFRCHRTHYSNSEECKQIRDLTYKNNDYIISVLLGTKIIKNKTEILDLKYASIETIKEISDENNCLIVNNDLNKVKEEIKNELKVMKENIAENKIRIEKQEADNEQFRFEIVKLNNNYNDLKTHVNSKFRMVEEELASVKKSVIAIDNKIDNTKKEILESHEKSSKSIADMMTEMFAKQLIELKGGRKEINKATTQKVAYKKINQFK